MGRCAGAEGVSLRGTSLKLARGRMGLSTTTPLPVSLWCRKSANGFEKRVAFAAAHVVVDPLRTAEPLTQPVIDWDATLATANICGRLALPWLEAMDTAQRGMGLDWPLALELIKRSAAAAKARGAVVASGAGTDHLPADATFTLQDVTDAYMEQCEAIEAVGGRIILMASRALARVARGRG